MAYRFASRLFVPLLAGANLRDRVAACVGALIGIAVTGFICFRLNMPARDLPLLVAPMGASAVLLFAVPASPLAQPWPIVGGNVLSALVGVSAALAFDDKAIAAGFAVGGAMLAMSLCRCLHPPGGAAALTAVIGSPAILSAGYGLAFMPIAVNSIILLATGLVFHRFSGHSYPHAPSVTLPDTSPFGLHRDDIDRALADIGETFDVDPSDLEALLERAEHHAELRRGAALPPANRPSAA